MKPVGFIGLGQIGAPMARRLLDRHGLRIEDIDFWAIHPGGTLVLEKVREKLGLDEAAIGYSMKVFENYGNMSSPSVLFVLNDILENASPPPGSRCLALSFGAGFTAHAMLLEIS